MFCRRCFLLLTSGLNLKAVLIVTLSALVCFMMIALIPTEVHANRWQVHIHHAGPWGIPASCIPSSEWQKPITSIVSLMGVTGTIECRILSFSFFFPTIILSVFLTEYWRIWSLSNPRGARNKCRLELSVLSNLSGQQSGCCTCGSAPSANLGCNSNNSSGRCWFARGLSR